ncbi:MAG: HemK2/MTQ2 family protein methyltransferase [Candidatus Aenigmatarchaeota archaeon]
MKFFYNKINIDVPEGIYYPREDSLLLAEALEKINMKNKNILEIGCGSGFLAILLAEQNNVTGTDMDKNAIETTRKNALANKIKLTVLQSDLFSNITGKFDVIVFNPPYLPEDEYDKVTKDAKHWSGGIKIIEKFIIQATKYLKQNGKIIFIISSLTDEVAVLGAMRLCGFSHKIIARQKIPWEELIVIKGIFKQ